MSAFDPQKKYVVLFVPPNKNTWQIHAKQENRSPIWKGEEVENEIVTVARGTIFPQVIVAEAFEITLSVAIKDKQPVDTTSIKAPDSATSPTCASDLIDNNCPTRSTPLKTQKEE